MTDLSALVFGLATCVVALAFGSWLEFRLKEGREGFFLGVMIVIVGGLCCFLILG